MDRAVRARNIEVLTAFLEYGLDVDAGTEEDDALKIAVEEGDAVVLGLLISSGFADVNKRFTNNMTPLLLTVSSDDQEDLLSVLFTLLKAGANINAQNDQGDCVLHPLSRFRREPAAFELVLERGADPDVKNQDNATPLMVLLDDTGGDGTRQYSTYSLNTVLAFLSVKTRGQSKTPTYERSSSLGMPSTVGKPKWRRSQNPI
ncbi:hypothetical protein Poli38472_012308 [Pythium oligandrum]|uniref:Uncharacterized protein n=1 Tax=Pythium oligandrum TaxID=41045 RepID=A0A8K1CP69_PYTOL|nr:hypothetical protein Poli38472_012308 [Pythium oligandrum]|eukprot:TMW67192.1 hypothetical protein Poli38472_012308 [Pythium oligandrum]